MAATEPKEANKNAKERKVFITNQESLGTIKFPDGSTESAMLEMCGYTDTETGEQVYEVVLTKGEEKLVLVNTHEYETASNTLKGAVRAYYFGCAIGYTNGMANSSCPL